MLSDLWLVGIGTGALGHLTLQGQNALRAASTILVPRKGAGKDDLADLRLSLLRQIDAVGKVVPFDMPVRDETLPYQERVSRWHDEIAVKWQEALAGAHTDGPVALMVWGDPGLYDSTLRIADRLDPKPTVRVVPGITALQALTAAHAVPFNTVDGSVCITTGRRLRENGLPQDAQSVFVMLDGACSFQNLDDPALHIWWGAFLGMREELLVSGPLTEVAEKIQKTRSEARSAHGWIMDTYLIRRLTETCGA
ncbi:MAG: precorrin-6A synthase (deacetylating) [Roseobacter sp.]